MDLGPWYPPSWVRKPPGMIWDDYQAWHPWLTGPGAAWDRYTYDVELYTQPLPPGETDPAMLRSWERATAKRIDAVGVRGASYTIFEARRIAGWSALAQLLGYRDLWRIQYPDLPDPEIALITETIDDTTRATAARHGIRTWSVGEPALA